MKVFVTGIGTGIGKTLISAILTEALQADYWKPVQAGNLDDSDTMLVKDLVSNSSSYFHEEAYRLQHPMSPHAAAELEKTEIKIPAILSAFEKIKSSRLVAEGAGGLMVPLNRKELVIDLIEQLKLPVILVSRNYLGNINHTLLSYEALKSRSIPVTGIVFNGPANKATEDFILEYTGFPCILRVNEENKINKETVKKYASKVKL